MTLSPKISVIIPTYNRCKLLVQSLHSVQNQSFQDFEIIVVDDASTDGTEALLEDLKRSDSRIRYLKLDKNLGLAGHVRNRGIAIARGQWIAFQDSDDLWVPEKLARQWQVIERNPSAVFIYSDADKVTQEGRREKYLRLPRKVEGQMLETLLFTSFIATPTVLIRKNVLSHLGGFDEQLSLKIAEDYDLFLRVAARHPFYFVREVLAICRKQNDNLTDDLLLGLDQVEIVLKKIIATEKINPRLARRALAKIELRRFKHGGFEERASLHLKKALEIDPFNLTAWLLKILVPITPQVMMRRILGIKASVC